MDRYIVREPRIAVDYPQGNQIIAFPTNASGSNNNMMQPETVFLGRSYAPEFANIQQVPNSTFMPVQMNTPYTAANLGLQGQILSGIDPRYLAAFGDNNSAQFIVTGQQMQSNIAVSSGFGCDYQNRNFIGADRNKTKTFVPQPCEPQRHEEAPKVKQTSCNGNFATGGRTPQAFERKSTGVSSTKMVPEVDLLKKQIDNPIMTRSDKLKALYKSGPRAFSGSVENVLKWHKAMQDVGVLVLYEIVAKCVSIRPAESCAKILVVRDDNGPAIQVVYYEIDFLLTELKTPCTVRVVGRMMPGTCRLQAFNVRPATGDDIAALPRRAAVAAHHVTKLCKEYGVHV